MALLREHLSNRVLPHLWLNYGNISSTEYCLIDGSPTGTSHQQSIASLMALLREHIMNRVLPPRWLCYRNISSIVIASSMALLREPLINKVIGSSMALLREHLINRVIGSQMAQLQEHLINSYCLLDGSTTGTKRRPIVRSGGFHVPNIPSSSSNQHSSQHGFLKSIRQYPHPGVS